ncbi:MAG: DUF2383 domain-containing protein [Limisphaerales bacterium]
MTAAIHHKTKLVSPLISSCYEAQEGYRSAASAVEDETLRRLFEIYAQQRTRFAEELREYLPMSEETDFETGTTTQFFGDQRVLSRHESIRECLEIDSRTLEMYKEALAHRMLPTRTHFLISSQLALLERVHDRMSTMLQDRAVRAPLQAQRITV